AWSTRASDQGPIADKYDNSKIMVEILELRQEKAELLGFSNYAEYSLATKMAPDPDAVLEFLNDLVDKSRPAAVKEFGSLASFAQELGGPNPLQPWDVAFYSEKLKKNRFDLTDDELRPYFPLPTVLTGMFTIVGKLYGISVKEQTIDNAWHEDVRFFDVHNKDGEIVGSFFADIFARQKKRGGAWMDDCIARKNFDSLQRPVAHLVCNFMPPNQDEPALLTHDEVLTLFHEFGHCLHHLLTHVDYPSVGGISGVAWDAVELPSQFMENFAWSKETLPLISSHYKTGEPIPKDMFDRLLEARVFHSAMQMVRQLEFALFDFRIHRETKNLSPQFVQRILNEVRNEVAVTPNVAYNRFSHSFSHIFSGGYAAGYYSYKWAEVLSADAFSAFEENGILNSETGKHFHESILAVGGTTEAMDAFVNFRGREPSVDALLRHTGLSE
ncbi:MAG: M3 family metallopeptidase, partial [Pseudomonadota bacterium]